MAGDYSAMDDRQLVEAAQNAKVAYDNAADAVCARCLEYAQHALRTHPDAPRGLDADGLAGEVAYRCGYAVLKGQVRADGTLRAYVKTACNHAVIDNHRERERRPDGVSLEGIQNAGHDQEGRPTWEPAVSEPGEVQELFRVADVEQRAAVWRVLLELSEDHRWALVRRHMDEATIEEMAREKDVPVETIYRLCDNARRAFRDHGQSGKGD